MRERIGYSNFVDKYGKVIFPILICVLYATFPFPLIWGINENIFANLQHAFSFSFLKGSYNSPLYRYLQLKKSYDSTMYQFYPTFEEFLHTQVSYLIFCSFVFVLFYVCAICTVVFFIKLYRKNIIDKGLLITIPSAYLVCNLISICIFRPTMPFVGFYTTLIFLILAILYCANAQLIPKPRQHKPTKSERIAELENQVAELTKEKDIH